jgi:hypothetical protein
MIPILCRFLPGKITAVKHQIQVIPGGGMFQKLTRWTLTQIVLAHYLTPYNNDHQLSNSLNDSHYET